MTEPSGYTVACFSCRASFDALDVTWCSCLATERTLVCPHCLQCFCKAPASYKSGFWNKAPRALWDVKFQEHNQEFQPPENPDPAAAPRPLVLIVDDEKDIVRVALRVVQSLGYGVAIARNGKEGLELTRAYAPDLVLTDALMPTMDGREMGRAIREDKTLRPTKIVVMTALYTNMRYKIEAHKAFQVDDYLDKPLDFERLKSVLQKHLG